MLEYAVDEARKLNDLHVGTEHLLLACARQDAGPAIELLRERDVSADRIRAETLRLKTAARTSQPSTSDLPGTME